MNFARARAIVDAVMMEGYALYPYRASAPKNRYRWTFGVLAPRAWSHAGGCEPWMLEAQLLVTGAPRRIAGQLRFFQIERDARWDEGVVRAIDFDASEDCEMSFELDAQTIDGRRRHALAGRVVIAREPMGERSLERITIRVENTTPWHELAARREQALSAAFASTHLLVGVDSGELLSAIDPPEWARAAHSRCANTGTYPVLLGSDLMLCAPFILYDRPQLAPESAGDLCDATEIDELLMLRTRTLTDDEKRQARETSPRTAAIVARADALSDERLARMHGATRDVRDGEMVPRRELAVGCKVRLRVPSRPTDAQDVLYAGHVATIVEIKQDVDGTWFYAATIDDDPAAELHDWYGRYRYYRADEVDPL